MQSPRGCLEEALAEQIHHALRAIRNTLTTAEQSSNTQTLMDHGEHTPQTGGGAAAAAPSRYPAAAPIPTGHPQHQRKPRELSEAGTDRSPEAERGGGAGPGAGPAAPPSRPRRAAARFCFRPGQAGPLPHRLPSNPDRKSRPALPGKPMGVYPGGGVTSGGGK